MSRLINQQMIRLTSQVLLINPNTSRRFAGSLRTKEALGEDAEQLAFENRKSHS
jgi:hypothetical protein